MRRRHGRFLLVVAWTMALVAGCGGGSGAPTSGPAATAGAGGNLPTGLLVTDLSKLCELLGPGDFTAAGFPGAGTPTVNSDGPGSAYCVYAGQSAATGGIEFDAFVDEDAEGTFEVIVSESTGELNPIEIPGVDAAVGTDGVAGSAADYATVVVRQGNLVFTIAAPGGDGASGRLATLAALVLARGSGLLG